MMRIIYDYSYSFSDINQLDGNDSVSDSAISEEDTVKSKSSNFRLMEVNIKSINEYKNEID